MIMKGQQRNILTSSGPNIDPCGIPPNILLIYDSWHTECSNPIETRRAKYIYSQNDRKFIHLVITNPSVVS